jgi:hypothetical protein
MPWYDGLTVLEHLEALSQLMFMKGTRVFLFKLWLDQNVRDTMISGDGGKICNNIKVGMP